MKTRRGAKEKYVPQDAYFHEAKKRGFVARSALKLEEIDQKLRLFKPGMRVLDLGCAPGSWLQYASRKVGPQGKVVGFDLDPVRVEGLKNAQAFVGDFTQLQVTDERLQGLLPVDLLQSDAMVKTTGISDSDCVRSAALVESALHLAQRGALKNGGALVAKVFEGPGFTELYLLCKKLFRRTQVLRPDAIRKGSREVYIVGQEFRPAPPQTSGG